MKDLKKVSVPKSINAQEISMSEFLERDFAFARLLDSAAATVSRTQLQTALNVRQTLLNLLNEFGRYSI